jgi:hypothetical protein
MLYSYVTADGYVHTESYPMGEAPKRVCLEDGRIADRLYDAKFTFAYGREDFHGPTINERREQQLIDYPTAEPVGQRWV